jgi:hypothetical protein
MGGRKKKKKKKPAQENKNGILFRSYWIATDV